MALPVLGLLGIAASAYWVVQPFQRQLQYTLNRTFPNQQLEKEEIITLFLRKQITEEQLRDRLKEFGYNDERINEIIKLSERLLSAEGYVVAFWRKEFSDDEKENERIFLEKMSELGFTEERAKLFERIRRFYPSPSDFIRFAVREVFNEEVVKQFGYDDDFPAEIVPAVRKAGMDPEILKWYWRAHWELPSPTAGYEMLHRLDPEVLEILGSKYKELGLDPDEIKTTLQTLELLLRTADIPSFWRKRLIAISYAPLTRVDLRRIYRLGLISDEELIARLRELGYSKRDAALLAEFYKKYKLEDEIKLTKYQIQKAFEFKLIDAERARQYLLMLGYTQREADLIISLWKFKERDEQIRREIKLLKDAYENSVLTYEQVMNRLDAMNLPSALRDRILLEIEITKASKEKLPSKEDLIKFLRRKVIDEKTFTEYMRKLNYSERTIKLYLEYIRRGGR